MLSTPQDWLPQVGVIIACCATVVVVHSAGLATAGASHHCLLCCSWWCLLYSIQYCRVGVIIACCATINVVHATGLTTASGCHHCLCHSRWSPLYRTDYCKWVSSLPMPQSMKSTLQDWLLQVGVIIACATVDEVHSTGLTTASGCHHCPCHSRWSPLYRIEYYRLESSLLLCHSW